MSPKVIFTARKTAPCNLASVCWNLSVPSHIDRSMTQKTGIHSTNSLRGNGRDENRPKSRVSWVETCGNKPWDTPDTSIFVKHSRPFKHISVAKVHERIWKKTQENYVADGACNGEWLRFSDMYIICLQGAISTVVRDISWPSVTSVCLLWDPCRSGRLRISDGETLWNHLKPCQPMSVCLNIGCPIPSIALSSLSYTFLGIQRPLGNASHCQTDPNVSHWGDLKLIQTMNGSRFDIQLLTVLGYPLYALGAVAVKNP